MDMFVSTRMHMCIYLYIYILDIWVYIDIIHVHVSAFVYCISHTRTIYIMCATSVCIQ